jgi:putative spermidine/putrescine transport system ATP-binding protein
VPATGHGLALAGVVDDVAFRGTDLLVSMTAKDFTGEAVSLISAIRPDLDGSGPADVRPGDRVTASAHQRHLVKLPLDDNGVEHRSHP